MVSFRTFYSLLFRAFYSLSFRAFYFTVIPSVVEESRGNEFFLIPRGKGLLLFNFSSARVGLVPLFKQRFHEMFRQAQHDRKLSGFASLIDLYARFMFVEATICRPLSVVTNKTFFSRHII